MGKQKELTLQQAHIHDGFFSPIYDVIRSVTVPDVIYKFEHDRGGAIDNFDRVRDGVLGEHAGPEWYDGLTYETMAGMADLLAQAYDPMMDGILDNYSARIGCAALKDPDGYVNTYTQTMEPTHRFGENGGFLRGQHDVYNAGCLVEAAVCHYRATGKVSLLDTAVKLAVYLCQFMGNPPKKNIVPAHSQPEEAMIMLYRLFAQDEAVCARYPQAGKGLMFQALAEFWIENRGVHCGLPDWDGWTDKECVAYIRGCQYGEGRPSWGAYAQDHIPVLEQTEIVGHAVRATLLYTGVAASAWENDRADYIHTAKRIWENMLHKRIHVTGGVGAIHQDEKFGSDYFLPQDAYLETCAAIGVLFFSHNMYLLTGEAQYMEAVENTLYNGALVGVALDGKRYSYINPILSDGSIHRWDWHACPCCPPMDLKLYGRLPRMIYSYDDNEVTVNLYIGGEAQIPLAQGGNWQIRQESEFPWQGRTRIVSESDTNRDITLRLRVPSWAEGQTLAVNGQPAQAQVIQGYLHIRRAFKAGDEVCLNLDMPVMYGCARPEVEACVGQIVLRRGPLLYCVEAVDNSEGLDFLWGPDACVEPVFEKDLLGGVVVLKGVDQRGKAIFAVPYFRWDNRAQGAMRMWLPAQAMSGRHWGQELYHYTSLR